MSNLEDPLRVRSPRADLAGIGIEIDEGFEDRYTSFAGGSSQAVQSDREVRQLEKLGFGAANVAARAKSLVNRKRN